MKNKAFAGLAALGCLLFASTAFADQPFDWQKGLQPAATPIMEEIRWFEQYGMQEGPFGDAETLAKAMAVSVSGVVEAGIAKSGAGKVRLLKREELNPNWNPKTDTRLTMWEVTQYLIHRLETGGEMAAAGVAGRRA